ncbi:MAG TPA: UDP-galactopyranose mutase [Opitutaceae bacterium]|nr:UDP-galactopyranose mutase [Opitutaceae bacterium]
MRESYDYVIVGAGFSGLVLAERLGAQGHRCLVVEKRDHIGGNCHDRTDRNGLLYHVYGPHYFRTNSAAVRDYLSRFTEWREVDYRAKVFARDRYWSFPVNLNTYRQLTDNPGATENEFKAYLAAHALPIANPANSKEAILASVGEELYDLFFRGYTAKQWGRPAEALDPSVCRRIPWRSIVDERYFTDEFQALPKHGYHRLFENLFAASGAALRLETDYRDFLPFVDYRHLIYTGPVDEYFGHCYGHLPYRTVKFNLEERRSDHLPNGLLQPALQINYPGSEAYTRTVELKHISGQVSAYSNIVREYSEEYRAGYNDPYYPVPGKESQSLIERYRELVDQQTHVTFIGRLAQYRYLNMDQVVAAALHTADKLQVEGPAPSDRKAVVSGTGGYKSALTRAVLTPA